MFVFDCNDILFDETDTDSVYNQAEDYELSEEFIEKYIVKNKFKIFLIILFFL